MGRKSNFVPGIQEKWQRHRWLVLAALAILSAIFESAEFGKNPSYFKDPEHVIELIVQGAILPTVFIILQRTDARKNNAINNLSLLESFAYQLNEARDWNELVEVIVQFPRNVVPLSRISLWTRNAHTNTFELEIERSFSQSARSPNSLKEQQLSCIQAHATGEEKLTTCDCLAKDHVHDTADGRYCLPLTSKDGWVGLLHFDLLASCKLSEAQKDFFKSIVPEMVLSINKALMQRTTARREEKVEQEKQRLANELHDTLAQDLGYLRNKIEFLIDKYSYIWTAEVQQELEQLNVVAQEANRKLRNVITYSQPAQNVSLEARLLAYTKAIGRRANLQVSIVSSGLARELPSQVQFQIFLIFRELLANIEQHANAQKVEISIQWLTDQVEFSVADDGCGFELNSVNRNEHFGLAIIATRLQGMLGDLTIVSKPDQGTKVSVRIPIHAQVPLSSERSLV